MTNVAMNARVETTDGPCGELVSMIYNPVTWRLTHYVVKGKDLEPRSVPVELVAETTDDVVRLRCTRAELSSIEPFIETHYITSQMPVDTGYYMGGGYGMYYGAYTVPLQNVEIPVEDERLPPGELAVNRGARVEATDGYVGTVDQLMLEPTTGMITHLVLEEHHHLHKQQMTLPLSAIDKVLENEIFLKLDKHAVSLLPAIPIKRHFWTRHPNDQTEMLAAVFDDTGGASQALEFVRTLDHQRLLKIIEAAVLVKEQDGTTSVKETLSATGHGRAVGAVAGGLTGLLAGPVGVLVGALVGAGAGGAIASNVERDFSREFLDNLQQYLQPGRSGLILLVEHEGVQKLNDALGTLKGVVTYLKLSDTIATQTPMEEPHPASPSLESQGKK